MVVPLPGRPAADVVRVPVGGKTVAFFASIFRPVPNRGLRSRPSCVCHANFALTAGVEWIGDIHHSTDNWPLAFALDGPISLLLGLACQPLSFRRGEVDRLLDGATLDRSRALDG